MPNPCGKPVYSQRMKLRTTRAQLSPNPIQISMQATLDSVQLRLTHYLSLIYTPGLSPAKIAVSPLTEHYLYPVSTGPINRPTQMKFKER